MILPEYGEKLAELERRREAFASAYFVINKEVRRLCDVGEDLLGREAVATPERLARLAKFIDEARVAREQSIKVRNASEELKKQFEALMEINEAIVETMRLTGTSSEEGV